MARRRVFLCILAILIAQIVARPAQAQAAQWANLATVSNSTSLQAGSLCATDGRDIYCNSSVATLSGLAQADRLVSGSAALILSPTGVLNLTGRLELNSGTGVVGIGTNAALNSKGNYVVALSTNAARNNSATSVNALGYAAAQDNGGDIVNALGHAAARINKGSFVNAMGWAAAFGNTGSSVNAFGYGAAQYNTGSSVNAFGSGAALYNTGTDVDALGFNAAISNTGSNVVAIGRYAAKVNTFSNVVALGYNAQPDKANQIVLGNASIVEVTTTGVILAAGISTTGTVSATDIKLARNATPPAAKCASSADEGRTIMTPDGPYVCLMR